MGIIYTILGVFLLLVNQTSIVSAEGNKPNILVMAEDGDKDGIPRKNRISTLILNAIVTELDSNGFDVYDETAVTLKTHAQGRSRRTDAELIEIVKSIRKPPIDVVVFFMVYPDIERKTYTNELRLRVSGRMLGSDGRRLGSWNSRWPIGDEVMNLPNRCFPKGEGMSRRCLLEAIGEEAAILGAETGASLVEKLDIRMDARLGDDGLVRNIHLIFSGFTSPDIRDMEEYLIIFSGYKHHQAIRSSGRRHELSYETTIKTSKLERNLHKMMELLELPYELKYSGNTYSIKSKQLRKKRDGAEQTGKFKW